MICWPGCLPAPLPLAFSLLDVGVKTPSPPWGMAKNSQGQRESSRPPTPPCSCRTPASYKPPKRTDLSAHRLGSRRSSAWHRSAPPRHSGLLNALVLTPEGRLGLEGRTRLRATSICGFESCSAVFITVMASLTRWA